MIEIDGSLGEGGGQLLRSALSLSCITGKAFRISHIRQSRPKPGLMRQHLVSVLAAARIAAAKVSGGELGATELSFLPGAVSPGDYSFEIGTAGSVALVLQTLIPPLLLAGRPSSLTLSGGTHVPFAPSWHYLSWVFAPTLSRLGAHVELTLESCGFYPKGGGRVRCRIVPCAGFTALGSEPRGKLLRVSGLSAVGNLPRSIAERQAGSALGRIESALGAAVELVLPSRSVAAFGQGTFVFIKGEYEHAVSGCTALGARGKPAEAVGEEAAAEFLSFHATGMPVDPHLADQLVLYLAQAKGTSVLATSCITGHLLTNLLVTGLFLDLDARISGRRDAPGTVTITPGSR